MIMVVIIVIIISRASPSAAQRERMSSHSSSNTSVCKINARYSCVPFFVSAPLLLRSVFDPIRAGVQGVRDCKLHVFDRGSFWVLLLTYLYLPKGARAYLFPRSVEMPYFCSGPISVDPNCPQLWYPLLYALQMYADFWVLLCNVCTRTFV